MAITLPFPSTVLALAAVGLFGLLLAVVWPVAALGLAVALVVCAVALRAPALGLVGGVLVAGTEGLFKARLNAESIPSANGVGAIGLDLILAAVAVWLCVRVGRRPFIAVWREGTRGEHIAWL